MGPDASVTRRTHTIGWRTAVFWSFGKFYSVTVPACGPCARVMRWSRLARLLVTGAFAVAGIAVAVWLLDSYDGPLKSWLRMLVALACLSPFILWETFFPEAFDVTCYAKSVDFAFRNEGYAREFEWLNRSAASAPSDGNGPRHSGR